jgi:hypothetical protein
MRRKYNLVILLGLLTGWSIGVQAAQKRALSEHDLIELLARGVYNGRIAQLVRDRGISFVPSARDLGSLRHAGAALALLNAVESARHVTAQLPEYLGKHQLERRVPPPPVPHNVESIPHNALNIHPATSIVPRAAPATAPTLPTTNVRAPGSLVAVIPAGRRSLLENASGPRDCGGADNSRKTAYWLCRGYREIQS